MKDWEKRNCEEIVEAAVGMSLEGIEGQLGVLATKQVGRLMTYLEKRFTRPGGSFAEVLQGLCELEAGRRIRGESNQEGVSDE